MKKYSLSLILVLCLFVITGGTYAAWTYYEGAVEALPLQSNVTITESPEASVKGTLTDNSSNLGFKIDESSTAYTPELKVTGSLKIKYTSNVDLKSEAPSFTYEIKQTGSLFNLPSGAQSMTFEGSGKNWTCEIAGTDLGITLAATKALPTREDYLKYKKLVEAAKITITISEAAK